MHIQLQYVIRRMVPDSFARGQCALCVCYVLWAHTALGGKTMSTLFITSLDGSLNGLSQPNTQVHAGSLFKVEVPYSGLREPCFAY